MIKKIPFLKQATLKLPQTNYSRPIISLQNQRPDVTLLSCVAFLSVFGLLMVYDASQLKAFTDFGDKYFFLRQQIIWVILGFFSLGFFSIFDYHKLEKLAAPIFFLSLALLLLVFIPGLGVNAGGAHRWLKVAGFTLQPAEIIKLAAVIFFSVLFQHGVRSRVFIFLTMLIGVIIGVLQKDLGSTVVFTVTVFGIYFISGASLLYFAAFLLLGIASFAGFTLTSPYRLRRVLAFLDPFADPQGYSYHISQILIALGSGGFWGLGIGQSRQKFAYIPEVTTDSIFSVVGEELGFAGGVTLLILFGFLITRGFRIAQNAPDNFGRLLASGLTIWLGTQAVINLMAMVSLIPLTGVPLPFISYGGSAMLVNLIAVGILLNISRQGST